MCLLLQTAVTNETVGKVGPCAIRDLINIDFIKKNKSGTIPATRRMPKRFRLQERCVLPI